MLASEVELGILRETLGIAVLVCSSFLRFLAYSDASCVHSNRLSYDIIETTATPFFKIFTLVFNVLTAAEYYTCWSVREMCWGGNDGKPEMAGSEMVACKLHCMPIPPLLVAVSAPVMIAVAGVW